MANLVKITEVTLMTGFTAGAAECCACKKLLQDSGIKYQLLHYGDESTHHTNFDALSTWTFGPNFEQRTFTDFPVVTWKEFYDDYERWIQVAQSSEELAASNLLKNISLVQYGNKYMNQTEEQLSVALQNLREDLKEHRAETREDIKSLEKKTDTWHEEVRGEFTDVKKRLDVIETKVATKDEVKKHGWEVIAQWAMIIATALGTLFLGMKP